MGAVKIRRNWKVGGVLTDVTSAKLSDPTGTYGIKRDDTDATVVADGTDISKLSTGIYEYDFTTIDGIEYTAWVEFVYDGQTYHFQHDIEATSAVTTGLKIHYDEVRREVGRALGFNRAPGSFEANETTDVADVIKAGLRDFYWPPDIEGVPEHKWSFLCPPDTISLVNGTEDYDLPADFVRLGSKFTYATLKQPPLAKATEEEIRALRSTDPLSGIPKYYAIRPKIQSEDRYELMVYPTPNTGTVLDYKYEMVPAATLSDGNPYHLGPACHSQTFLMACLMNADRALNKETVEEAGGGLYAKKFADCLRSSIALDQQVYG